MTLPRLAAVLLLCVVLALLPAAASALPDAPVVETTAGPGRADAHPGSSRGPADPLRGRCRRTLVAVPTFGVVRMDARAAVSARAARRRHGRHLPGPTRDGEGSTGCASSSERGPFLGQAGKAGSDDPEQGQDRKPRDCPRSAR